MTVQAYVVIQNKNIGHSLIPEVRDLYEAWVEFTVKDAAGNDDLPQRISEARRHAGCARAQLHQSPGES